MANFNVELMKLNRKIEYAKANLYPDEEEIKRADHYGYLWCHSLYEFTEPKVKYKYKNAYNMCKYLAEDSGKPVLLLSYNYNNEIVYVRHISCQKGGDQ